MHAEQQPEQSRRELEARFAEFLTKMQELSGQNNTLIAKALEVSKNTYMGWKSARALPAEKSHQTIQERFGLDRRHLEELLPTRRIASDVVEFFNSSGNDASNANEPAIPLDTSWQADAACHGMGADPNIFYSTNEGDMKAAKLICASCVVRIDCLEFSLATAEPFGIWGGLSQRQRNKLLGATEEN